MRSDGRARCGPHCHQKEKIHHGPAFLSRPRSYGRKATPRAGSAAPFRMHRAAAAGRRCTRLLPGRRICRTGRGRAATGLGRRHLDRCHQRRANRRQCPRTARRAAQNILGANHGREAWPRRLARAAVRNQRYPARLDEPDECCPVAGWGRAWVFHAASYGTVVRSGRWRRRHQLL
jgi:hypothetical protein